MKIYTHPIRDRRLENLHRTDCWTEIKNSLKRSGSKFCNLNYAVYYRNNWRIYTAYVSILLEKVTEEKSEIEKINKELHSKQ